MADTQIPDGGIAHGLADFVTAGVTPVHVVAEAARRLDAAGYHRQDPTQPWDDSRGGHYLAVDGTIIAWYLPDRASASTGLRIVATHTDSPVLTVKPHPDFGAAGWQQVAVEIYGGPLWNSWLDRDLGVAGRLARIDGSTVLVDSTGPLLRIPQLAPHLDRSVNPSGLQLNPQQHLMPLWGLGDARDGDLLAHLAAGTGLDPAEVVAHHLTLHDATPPALLGRDRDLLAAPRLDNLASTHAALTALIEIGAAGADLTVIPVVAAFDHEEIGSGTATGADGPLLSLVLTRIGAVLGGGTDELGRMYAASRCLSADAAHAVNPNYLSFYDPAHHLQVNRGPALKFHASQSYGTTAEGAAAWHRAAAAAGIPVQTFVSRNDVSCGSTLGRFVATGLGITTLDIGIPVLAMHSAREMCGVDDVAYLRTGVAAFLTDPV